MEQEGFHMWSTTLLKEWTDMEIEMDRITIVAVEKSVSFWTCSF